MFQPIPEQFPKADLARLQLPARPLERDSLRRALLYLEDSPARALAIQALPSLGKLEPETRLSVCIPVAAHQEARFIRDSLDAYRRQSLPHALYEVCLFLNFPQSPTPEAAVEIEKTRRIVTEYQCSHPELRLRACAAPLTAQTASIGIIRRVLLDALLMRTIDAQKGLDTHTVVRADADTRATHPRLLETLLRQLTPGSFGGPAGVRGRIDFDWPTLSRDPLLYCSSEMWRACDVWSLKRGFNLWPGGANFAYTLWRYIQAGGYPTTAAVGEDCFLGAELRKHGSVVTGKSSATIWSSARRSAFAVNHGVCVSDQWTADHTTFRLEDSVIRRDYCDSFQLEQFRERIPDALLEIEDECNQTLSSIAPLDLEWSESELARVKAERSECAYAIGSVLGLDYQYDDETGNMRVLDSCRLRARLEYFADHAEAVWKRLTTGEPR